MKDDASAELQRLSGIVALAADAIISTDSRFEITLFNQGAERIFGYSASEMLGQPLNVLLPQRFRDGHTAHMRQFGEAMATSREMAQRREIAGLHKSGKEFPAEASISVFAANGERTFTVVLRDVSERKAAAEALRRSEERIRLAVEDGGIGLFEHDHHTGASYWSPIYRGLFGIGADVPPSKGDYLTRVLPKDRPQIQAAIAAALSPDGDGVFHIDHRIVRGDGTESWISVNSRTYFENRTLKRTIGAVRDITERKANEAILERRVAERTAELAAVLDVAPDCVLTSGPDRTINTANAALTTLFGYGKAEIGTLKAPELYATAADSDLVETAWTLWESGGPKKPAMVTCRRKNGTTFPGMVLGSAVKGRDGAIVSRVKIIRDMTDELKRQTLAVQSQRMEALGQLTGGIAHDSNNLLTVISGNLEMVEDDLDGHPALKYLREAQEAASMGARLNQRLLTFARRRKLQIETVNLNDQVLAMSELLRRTLGEAIKLTTALAPDLGATLVDPSEIENAILNLAINARDAMPQGGVLNIETANTVFDEDEARVEKALAPGSYVRLSVSDTGTGMAPEVVSRVFEPFFTTKPPGKGTGLGLATVFGFVTQSNGHINVYSELGHGTTFNLYLPHLSKDIASGEPRVLAKTPPTAKGETVLAVEDNPQVRLLTVTRLKRLGYKVHEAANGPEALALIASGVSADLVFSDVVMPGGLSGFDLAREVLTRNGNQRVLLTSGFAEDMARGNETVLAGQRILRKPYSLAELAVALREVLDRQS